MSPQRESPRTDLHGSDFSRVFGFGPSHILGTQRSESNPHCREATVLMRPRQKQLPRSQVTADGFETEFEQTPTLCSPVRDWSEELGLQRHSRTHVASCRTLRSVVSRQRRKSTRTTERSAQIPAARARFRVTGSQLRAARLAGML